MSAYITVALYNSLLRNNCAAFTKNETPTDGFCNGAETAPCLTRGSLQGDCMRELLQLAKPKGERQATTFAEVQYEDLCLAITSCDFISQFYFMGKRKSMIYHLSSLRLILFPVGSSSFDCHMPELCGHPRVVPRRSFAMEVKSSCCMGLV